MRLIHLLSICRNAVLATVAITELVACNGVNGECKSIDAGATTPGGYGASQISYGRYMLLKFEDALDRCLIVTITYGDGAAYGVAPNNGFGIESVRLTNAVADCNAVQAGLPLTGQMVEASCGSGSLTVEPCTPEVIMILSMDATFEFTAMFPWVPAADDANANASELGPFDCGE